MYKLKSILPATKAFFLSVLLCCAITTVQGQSTPHVEWARGFGGSGNDRANCVANDAKGNIIVVGRYQSSSIDFDQIKVVKTPDDKPDVSDIFIVKFDKNGKTLWAIGAGGKGDDHATSCAIDKVGNVYVVGWFESASIKLGDIVITNTNTTGNGGCDFYVAKFSPEGQCLWGRNAGGKGASGDYGTVSLDNKSNVVVSGIFTSEMNFGNGVLLKTEKENMYVAKYTTTGKLLWAKSAIGSGEAQGNGVDADGNIFVGGYFTSDTFNLGGITLKNRSTKGGDAFLVKYTPDGKALWANRFGGDNAEIATIDVDKWGNALLAGPYFSRTIKEGKVELTNNGEMNTFVTKYDRKGNLLWAKGVGGKVALGAREFHSDQKGNIFVTGSNMSDFTFAGNTVKNVAGSEDAFLLKFDKDGNEKWAIDFGGANRNAGRGVAIDNNGSIFLTGSFDEKSLKVGDTVVSNIGDSDIFLVKLTEKK